MSDLSEVIINELATRSLNSIADPEYDSDIADAIYGLSQNIRRGSLAIYLGLIAMAEAIRERSDGPG